MSRPLSDRRVFILGNPEKWSVTRTLTELKDFVAERCNLVGGELGVDAGSLCWAAMARSSASRDHSGRAGFRSSA